MSDSKILITTAGLEEVVNAEKSGTAPVVLSHIAFGTGKYTPSADRTELQAEFKRFDAIAGGSIGDNVIHIDLHDNSTEEYTVYEVGVFTESGTLFAVYSQSTPILQKAATSEVMLAVNITLTDIDAESITVGDTNFVLNPATTEKQGTVELATNAEAIAGTDIARAITPAALKAKVDNYDAGVVHKAGTETITGQKVFTASYTQLKNPATSGGSGLKVVDSNGKGEGKLEQYYAGDYYYTRLACKNISADKSAHIDIKIKDDGTSEFSPSNIDIMQAPTPPADDNSSRIATTACVENKLLKYLQLKGGVLSGKITFSTSDKGIETTGTDLSLCILGSNGHETGSGAFFYGQDHSMSGKFIIRAGGTEGYADLQGFPDGSITWKNKNIVRSVNNTNADANGNVSISSVASATKATQDGNGNVIADTYVDKTSNQTIAGNKEFTGTLTNDDKYVLNNSFLMPVDNGAIMMTAGTSSAGGAYFRLYGKNNSSGAGQFVLAATNGTNTKALTGKPDGTLTWAGNEVSTHKVVSTLPAAPDSNVFYYIPE